MFPDYWMTKAYSVPLPRGQATKAMMMPLVAKHIGRRRLVYSLWLPTGIRTKKTRREKKKEKEKRKFIIFFFTIREMIAEAVVVIHASEIQLLS